MKKHLKLKHYNKSPVSLKMFLWGSRAYIGLDWWRWSTYNGILINLGGCQTSDNRMEILLICPGDGESWYV